MMTEKHPFPGALSQGIKAKHPFPEALSQAIKAKHPFTAALSQAKHQLDEGDCTLVVANHGEARKFHQRGVHDLLALLSHEPDFLAGAAVADKIVGKAAAALMIEGKVSEVFTRTITSDAKTMLEQAGIGVSFDNETPIVENRTKTGRCPLDTLCADISEPSEMLSAIRQFLNQQPTSNS